MNLESEKYKMFAVKKYQQGKKFVECVRCLSNYVKVKKYAKKRGVELNNIFQNFSKKFCDFAAGMQPFEGVYGSLVGFELGGDILREKSGFKTLNYFLRKIKFLEFVKIDFESGGVKDFLAACVSGKFENFEKIEILRFVKCSLNKSRFGLTIPKSGFKNLKILEFQNCDFSSKFTFEQISKIVKNSKKLEILVLKKNNFYEGYEEGLEILCSTLSTLRNFSVLDISRNRFKSDIFPILIEHFFVKENSNMKKIDISNNALNFDDNRVIYKIYEKSAIFTSCKLALDHPYESLKKEKIVKKIERKIIQEKVEKIVIEAKEIQPKIKLDIPKLKLEIVEETEIEKNNSNDVEEDNDNEIEERDENKFKIFLERVQNFLNFNFFEEKNLNHELDYLVRESIQENYTGDTIDLLHHLKQRRDFKVNKMIFEKFPSKKKLEIFTQSLENIDPFYPIEGDQVFAVESESKKIDNEGNLDFLGLHPKLCDYSRIPMISMKELKDYFEVAENVDFENMRKFNREIFRKSSFLLSEFGSYSYLRSCFDPRLRLARFCFKVKKYFPLLKKFEDFNELMVEKLDGIEEDYAQKSVK